LKLKAGFKVFFFMRNLHFF